MSNHAKLSPSAAHRWMACPGSLREEAKYPGEQTNEYAIDGTHSHTLLEHCIKNELCDPMGFVGITLPDHYGQFTIDDERARRVKIAVDYIIGRKDEAGGPVAIRSEEKVNPGSLLERDDLWGTADVQLIGNTSYEVIDYKDGMTPVDCDGPQNRIYALGGILPYADESGIVPFDNVTMTIVQPKLAVMGKEPVSTHDMSVDELIGWYTDKLVPAVEATDDPDAPLVAGSHCKYCKASGNCATQAEETLGKAQLLFGSVDIADQAANHDPNQMTDEQIKEIIEVKPLVMSLIKAVEEESMKRFKNGHNIPGLKVVYGRGKREWEKTDEEVEKVLKSMGVPKKDMYISKLVTAPQVDKLTWVKRNGDKKSLTERQLKKLSEEFISKSKGSKTVVSESDPRSAVEMNPAAVFDNVEPATAAIPDWLSGGNNE